MTRKIILPLTYLPKIQPVIEGKCTQTLRTGRRVTIGDLVLFHGWSGKPYYSSWSFKTPYWRVREAWPIKIFPEGLQVTPGPVVKWDCLDNLAAEDGIDPPTGEALRDVLLSMHRIPENGLEAQIIRWISGGPA